MTLDSPLLDFIECFTFRFPFCRSCDSLFLTAFERPKQGQELSSRLFKSPKNLREKLLIKSFSSLDATPIS